MQIFNKTIILRFSDSMDYWEKRYRSGGNSGKGSYDKLAKFKAKIINKFVQDHNVKSIIEFGCGDGNQLSLAKYSNYLGIDVSPKAIAICIEKFKGDNTKSFFSYTTKYFENMSNFLKADATLSLDVIYHLLEDSIYEKYLHDLFECSDKYVIIYSSNDSSSSFFKAPHVKHRKFTNFVEKHFTNFKLLNQIENDYPEQSPCKFFIYEKNLD